MWKKTLWSHNLFVLQISFSLTSFISSSCFKVGSHCPDINILCSMLCELLNLKSPHSASKLWPDFLFALKSSTKRREM